MEVNQLNLWVFWNKVCVCQLTSATLNAQGMNGIVSNIISGNGGNFWFFFFWKSIKYLDIKTIQSYMLIRYSIIHKNNGNRRRRQWKCHECKRKKRFQPLTINTIRIKRINKIFTKWFQYTIKSIGMISSPNSNMTSLIFFIIFFTELKRQNWQTFQNIFIYPPI